MKKVTWGDIAAYALMIAIMSAIGAVILEFIYIVCFFIFHDCGKWFCTHEPDMSWSTYFICYVICFLVLSFIMLVSENSDQQPRQQFQRRKTTRRYYSTRETDYYDSDMEGAPGYYGFD